MGIIAAGQITVVDLSDAPVLNTFITASRPTTQTYSKDSRTYKPSYASTPQVLTLKVTKAGSTANIIDSISSLHWFVVDGPIKTEITSKDNSANEYISGTHNEILTTKLDIDLNKGSKRYEVMGIWPDPSTGLDVQFGGYIDLFLTQNGATGPQGPQGNTGNGIANTVITYGLSMSDTTEPATWSSEMPALVKGMYLWTRTVIIYTNGGSTTSYQISYIAKDADATAEIDKAKQELLEKLETVRDESLEAVDEAKQQLVTVRDESLAAAEEAKQDLANVNTKVDNAKEELTQAKQDLANVASELNTAKQDLSSELKQTKDGITLLATKTELNTAKSDLQSGINTATNKANNNAQTISTHTNQISALNTGLQAKVSQSEFNTLSGRVTTAENNITAKANELSSKITSVEGKIPTSVGAVNLFKGSRDFNGSNWQNKHIGIYAEDYNGVKIFKTQVMWNGCSQYFEVKAGEEYVFSAYVKSSAKTDGITFFLFHESKQPMASGLVSFASNNNQDNIGFGLTDKYQRIAIKIKITKDGWIMPRLERSNSDAYLFFGGYKLERGNVATDWSPAPEDTISQIDAVSSELKQTKDGITLLATKTELNSAKNELQSGINTATNKANAAQNTANNNAQTISTHTTQISALNTGLQAKVSQTEFNTLSGRVTSAENNITAKANELSSKITSVEGKIPTSIGGRNLWIQSKTTGGFVEETLPDNHITGQKKCYRISNNNELAFNIEPDFSSRLYRKVTFSAWVKYDNVAQGSNDWNVFNCFKHSLYCKNSSTGATSNISWLTLEGFTGTSDWKYITYTYDYSAIKSYDQIKTSIFFNLEHVRSGTAWVTGVKIEIGSIPSDYSPAPEDTISQISSLSSELKQTKDGITLLATKTELNSAKNELQSGINTATNKANSNAQTINTHTTQISALNTGLQAKVSQTEFNTLSGRVTSAENNITAKANELSSKITSVEGKIPTSVGAVNLFKGSRDFSGSWVNGYSWVYAEEYQGVKIFKTQDAWSGLSQYFEVKTGEEYVFSAYVKSSAKTDGVNFFLVHESKQPMATGHVSSGSVSGQNSIYFELTDKYKRIAIKIKITKDGWIMPRLEHGITNAYLFFGGYKLERGNVATDWSPAPEDTISQISSLSSELKQTKDGITLLATKTELNSAKNELQSGINTATNKANSNAQTISTHTNQISALNTGLSAKVSQSDFNTLSGRVTNAENNITAKANELSSKITTVEGKIPTSVGAVNLFKGSRDFSGSWMHAASSVYAEDYKGVKIFKRQYAWQGLSQYFEVKTGEEYVFSAYVRSSAKTDGVNFFLVHESKQPMAEGVVSFGSTNSTNNVNIGLTDKYKRIAIKIKITKDGWMAPRLERYNSDHYLLFGGYKLERGNVATDWSPAPEDYDSKLAAAQSEFKQTTDSIKASVSSLDKSTVKSSSLTINSDGIVMKAGKSTTDVANAIGSYFAVNQNAINLFSDKINVKGSMIVNGTITGDKIKASSVDVSKIVGIDANFIKSKIEYAMIDWLKGKTITAYNGNMTIDLQNGRISFKDGSNAVYRQTSDGIHTGFLHFEAGIQGGVYAAFGTTSTRQGINSKSSEFAGIRCYRVSANGDSHDAKIDKIEVIGDTVQFGHTYHPNGTIGGGFIMNTAAYYDDTPYSLNRMVSSIESLWRILYVHGKNVGYNLSHPNFINALRDEYNAWHDMHNR